MTTQALEKRANPAVIERVVIEGDLAILSAQERLTYYQKVCESLGINPLTKPFSYIKLNGRLVLYALRDATDQIRKLHHVSVHIMSREIVNEVYIVTAKASLPDGRSDESIGAVPIAHLNGDNMANAIMKAETKAKRRVTLSIIGLGWLDETETSTIANTEAVKVNLATGEIEEMEQRRANPQTSPSAGHARAIEVKPIAVTPFIVGQVETTDTPKSPIHLINRALRPPFKYKIKAEVLAALGVNDESEITDVAAAWITLQELHRSKDRNKANVLVGTPVTPALTAESRLIPERS